MKPLHLFMTTGILAASFTATALGEPARAFDSVGVRTAEIPLPARQTKGEVIIWYPAASGGSPVRIGDSKVLVGVSAQRDALPAPGPFPIVLLSQGGLRSAPNLGGWLAVYLAAHGYVVVTIRPPQLTADSYRAASAEIWLRPADLSAALDVVVQDSALAGPIATDQVAVLGMQLGGAAALALAGGRLDADRYSHSCDQEGTGMDCAWFAKNGIDLSQIDSAEAGGSHLDPRIKAIMVIDPEESSSFTPTSLAGIKMPVALVNLGSPGEIAPALDVGHLQRLIPGASYQTVAGASRFSAFSTCTAKGAVILRAEGDDDALCHDGGAGARDEIHDQLASLIQSFLDQHLRR